MSSWSFPCFSKQQTIFKDGKEQDFKVLWTLHFGYDAFLTKRLDLFLFLNNHLENYLKLQLIFL